MVRHAWLVASCFWIYFQTCYSDGYPGITSCCRKLARERRKRSLPARAETAKNLFHQPRTELSSSSWRCGVESGQSYLPNSKMTTTSIMCFDRHAIAVTTIGDNGNKSLYLPRKHLSIHTHKRSFFSRPPADHIMLPPTARQHAACLFWSPFNSSANGSRSPQYANIH